jgi:hypothetical protein
VAVEHDVLSARYEDADGSEWCLPVVDGLDLSRSLAMRGFDTGYDVVCKKPERAYEVLGHGVAFGLHQFEIIQRLVEIRKAGMTVIKLRFAPVGWSKFRSRLRIEMSDTSRYLVCSWLPTADKIDCDKREFPGAATAASFQHSSNLALGSPKCGS